MNSDADDVQSNGKDDAGAWLDGLAGRPGLGPDAADGQRLRDVLLKSSADSSPRVPWSEIEQLAAAAEKSAAANAAAVESGPASVADPAVKRTAIPAANDSQWRFPWGIAAAVVLASAVMLGWEPWRAPVPDTTTLRGINAPADTARWQVADPAPAAAGLATELRALGAQVVVQPEANGTVLLLVETPAAAQGAVNQRLVALETALDVQGRLRLRVQGQ